ncbi:AlpA family phage regulatory protein [Aliarcobacter butzleri]|nr:AlpA family phage regulatory protein [Aliarcobacter butzleri]MCG3708456.1 AlpA family phage regulatory protein [Aliarcobacter butzleri]
MGNFLRIKDVMKKTGIAKSTIWLWVSVEISHQCFHPFHK